MAAGFTLVMALGSAPVWVPTLLVYRQTRRLDYTLSTLAAAYVLLQHTGPAWGNLLFGSRDSGPTHRDA